MSLAADLSLAYAAPSKPASADRGAEFVLWLMPTLLLILTLAVKTYGLVALTMLALALVPVMFAIIIWITLP